jgi:lipopolysaccharide transport system ATP-binding protein
MTTAISVENLSKSYHLGQIGTGTFSNDLKVWWAKKLGKPNPLLKIGETDHGNRDGEEIWALKDVSFTVQQGEVLGIIGRNGAGKSTLLKILSRVTAPTSGRVKVKGRIASLLEVGTGFHPELTGRENIYLNGAILGMTKQEVARKFDEIVAFAEIEKFIDTPVKRYSSGMYVRLAFAVAAYLDPEILVVDEVLAVGDAEFQKKCLGKMQNLADQGRTVLFVSHNLAAVQALCDRGIILSAGRICMDDNVVRTVEVYLGNLEQSAMQEIAQRTDRHGKGQTKLSHIEILAPGNLSSRTLVTGQSARFVFQTNRALTGLSCIFSIYNQNGALVTSLDSAIHSPDDYRGKGLIDEFICDLEELPLTPGRYRINVALMIGGELQDHVEGAISFDVAPGVMRGRPIESNGGRGGSVIMAHLWKSVSKETFNLETS